MLCKSQCSTLVNPMLMPHQLWLQIAWKMQGKVCCGFHEHKSGPECQGPPLFLLAFQFLLSISTSLNLKVWISVRKSYKKLILDSSLHHTEALGHFFFGLLMNQNCRDAATQYKVNGKRWNVFPSRGEGSGTYLRSAFIFPSLSSSPALSLSISLSRLSFLNYILWLIKHL